MKYFIISGSPIYGFRYIGPFDSQQLAIQYQKRNANSMSPTWWVGELLTPTEYNLKLK